MAEGERPFTVLVEEDGGASFCSCNSVMDDSIGGGEGGGVGGCGFGNGGVGGGDGGGGSGGGSGQSR